jgi:biotin operon repressor
MTDSDSEISEYEEKMTLQVLLKKGASQREIAKVWGMSQQAICKRIKKLGIEAPAEDTEVVA